MIQKGVTGQGGISLRPLVQEGGCGLVGAEGGERGKRKESYPVGADRLLEHGSTGNHRGVESGSQLKGDKRPRWVSDDGG